MLADRVPANKILLGHRHHVLLNDGLRRITGTMSSEPALRRVALLKQLPDRRQQAVEAVCFGGGLNLFKKLLNPLAGANLPAVLPVA